MTKFSKKMTAIGAAIMMAVSMMSVSASAENSVEFSLYISNYNSVTAKAFDAGGAAKAGYVDVTYKVTSIVSGCNLKRSVLVGGRTPSNSNNFSNPYTTVGTRNVHHVHSGIVKGDRIVVTVRLGAKPSGIGSAASGKAYGA